MENIIQIVAIFEPELNETAIYGLSDDGKVYYWEFGKPPSWILYDSSWKGLWD